MRDAELNLLGDIVKLIKKHGIDAFEGLARHLSDPELSRSLEGLLSRTAEVARKSSARGKGSSKPTRDAILSFLEQLEKSESEKAKILRQFYESFVEGSLLPTIADIKTFAGENGLPLLKAASREKLMFLVLRELSRVSQGEMESMVRRVRPVSRLGDRSLEGWSRIIMDGRDRPKDPK